MVKPMGTLPFTCTVSGSEDTEDEAAYSMLLGSSEILRGLGYSYWAACIEMTTNSQESLLKQ